MYRDAPVPNDTNSRANASVLPKDSSTCEVWTVQTMHNMCQWTTVSRRCHELDRLCSKISYRLLSTHYDIASGIQSYLITLGFVRLITTWTPACNSPLTTSTHTPRLLSWVQVRCQTGEQMDAIPANNSTDLPPQTAKPASPRSRYPLRPADDYICHPDKPYSPPHSDVYFRRVSWTGAEVATLSTGMVHDWVGLKSSIMTSGMKTHAVRFRILV